MKTIDYISVEKVENKSWTRGKRESGEKGEERRAGGERGGGEGRRETFERGRETGKDTN